jgi:NADH:ubiquinone oxidoreductase subunit H
MDQTHPTKSVNAVLVLCVLSFGLLTGGMLLIGISIVGFWKSLTPSDFVSWFAAHSSRLGTIMIPLGAITVLVSLAAAVVAWRSHAKQRRWAVIAALCALCVMVSYPIFFAGANASFMAGGLSDSAVRALLDKWAIWHWARTFLGLAGFVAAVLALQSSGR